MSNEPIVGDVLDTMPAATQGRQIATTDSPYLDMANIALSQGKVAEMRELMAMHKEWDAHKAAKAFTAAMADFKAEAGGITIAKSKRVSFKTSTGKTEYDHAELHDITRALVPVMAKYGLSHRWTLKQENNLITVDCVVTHRDGHSESVTMSGPADESGGKNKIQAIASTKSYLERYTFLAATGMATGGEIDNDGRNPVDDIEYISEEQEVVLRDLMEAYVPNKKAFGRWISSAVGYEVSKLMEIPADKFDTIHEELKRIALEKSDAS